MNYLLKNAQIYKNTGDLVEVDIYIKDGRFIEQADMDFGGDFKAIDLEKRIVLPGLIDSHIHGYNWATRELMPNIKSAKSIPEFLNIIKVHLDDLSDVEKASNFIYLSAWNEEQFIEKRMPTLAELDSVSADIPLLCSRICGHLAIANSALLKKLDWETWYAKNPSFVGLDHEDNPSGIIAEDFYNAVLASQSKESFTQIKSKLRFALSSLRDMGLSTIGSNDDSYPFDLDFWQALEELYLEDKTLPRYYAQIILDSLDQIREFKALQNKYDQDENIRITHIKLFMDGSLGARTAYLQENYADWSSKGMQAMSKDELLEWFLEADKVGVGLAIHAIGDQAMLNVVNAYLECQEKTGVFDNPNRHTIIHAQIHDEEIIDKIKITGLCVGTQPIFAISDWNMALDRLGERRELSYQFKHMSEQGIHQGFGSDSPVESANPLDTLSASMKHPAGEHASFDFYSALKCQTMENAYILSAEEELGAIEIGKLADLIVLDTTNTEDCLDVDKLRKLKVFSMMKSGFLF